MTKFKSLRARVAAFAPLLLLVSISFSQLTHASDFYSADSVYSPSETWGGDVSAADTSLDAEESKFLYLINQYRASYGLEPLSLSRSLTAASRWMSQDMADLNRFDHVDSWGRDPFVRMQAFDYPRYCTAGENIAAGNAGAQETFYQWKYSPGHNANMLEPKYRAIGIARATNPKATYTWYWTTDFGSVTVGKDGKEAK